MGATLIQLKLAEYGHIAKNADDKLPKKVVKNWEVLILLQRAPPQLGLVWRTCRRGGRRSLPTYVCFFMEVEMRVRVNGIPCLSFSFLWSCPPLRKIILLSFRFGWRQELGMGSLKNTEGLAAISTVLVRYFTCSTPRPVCWSQTWRCVMGAVKGQKRGGGRVWGCTLASEINLVMSPNLVIPQNLGMARNLGMYETRLWREIWSYPKRRIRAKFWLCPKNCLFHEI